MFKSLIIFIIAMTLINPITYSNQDSGEKNLNLTSHVKYISQEIGPRPAGSKNELKTANYVAEQFKKNGIDTEIRNFTYFSLNSPEIKKSENVVGTIPGVLDQEIIVCADLDTPLDKIKNNYTEGANDASTTLAVIIGLSELYEDKKPLFTIKLIAFGAGEDAYTYPVPLPSKSNLKSSDYYKITYIPYLVGSRQYLLENQNSINKTVAVISLDAVGIGEPCVVSEDAFIENNQFFLDYLVYNSNLNGYKLNLVDFASFKKIYGDEDPISHIYLPFAYAGIPSTFITSMENPELSSQTHNNSEIPGYLTVKDNYTNLVKNVGNEDLLEKNLQNRVSLVKNNIDNLYLYYLIKSII